MIKPHNFVRSTVETEGSMCWNVMMAIVIMEMVVPKIVEFN